MRRFVALAVVVALVGCVAHVPLAPPPTTASADERVASYAANGPLAIHSPGMWRPPELILRNGAVVTDPSDLLPVVAPDSATARAVHRGREAHRRALGLAIGGLTIELAGTAWLVANAMRYGGTFVDGQMVPIAPTHVWVPLAAIGLGAGVALSSIYYAMTEKRERAVAFATYDQSLRAQLRICTNGLAVVACP